MISRGIKNFCLFILMAFLCVGGVALADGNDPAEKALIVGTSADYPPFEFIKDEEIVGFDIDLANKIAEKLGYKLQTHDMKFSSIVSSLQTDRIDFGISCLTITPERAKNVAFSAKYFVPKFAMLYKKEEPVRSVKDLDRKTISAQVGTTMESFLQEELKTGKEFKLVSLDKNHIMVEDLKLGRINGVLVEESQAKAFVKKCPGLAYSEFGNATGYGYAIAFKKGSPLKAKFDKAIRSLKKSGELKRLEQKWLIG